MAPELWEKSTLTYSFEVDLYSLGLIIWEVLQPLKDNEVFKFGQLVNEQKTNILQIQNPLIPNATTVILSLTERDPNLRLKSIFSLQLNTQKNNAFTAKDSSELANYLEICEDGDVIILATGVFIGEFILHRNNVTLQGQPDLSSIITGTETGLHIKGNGNTVEFIGFENCLVNGVLVNGTDNVMANLVIKHGACGVLVTQPQSHNFLRNVEFDKAYKAFCCLLNSVVDVEDVLVIQDAGRNQSFIGVQVYRHEMLTREADLGIYFEDTDPLRSDLVGSVTKFCGKISSGPVFICQKFPYFYFFDLFVDAMDLSVTWKI